MKLPVGLYPEYILLPAISGCFGYLVGKCSVSFYSHSYVCQMFSKVFGENYIETMICYHFSKKNLVFTFYLAFTLCFSF